MSGDPIAALKRAVAEQIKLELERHYPAGAALLMQTDLPRVSDVKRGNLKRLSLETLIRYATRLGVKVEVRFSRSAGRARSGIGPGA